MHPITIHIFKEQCLYVSAETFSLHDLVVNVIQGEMLVWFVITPFLFGGRVHIERDLMGES